MIFPDSWFEDEIRNGFYVPSLMKRNWAASMLLMEEIAQVCEKHNIRWFVCAGTLLGAVRHKGFIPWDDDIDLYMLREDFIKFKAVAMKELPEGYCWTDPTKIGNTFLTWKVANHANTLVDTETKKKFFGHPFQVHIDTFILDAIPTDKEEEQYRDTLGNLLQFALGLICTLKKPDDDPDVVEHIAAIENLRGKPFDHSIPLRDQLFEFFDYICRYTHYTTDKDAEEVSCFPYWVFGTNPRHPTEAFKESVTLSFEGISVRAPQDYDGVLKSLFGDYMQIRRSGGCRGYPYYGSVDSLIRSEPDSTQAYPHMHENDLRAEDARSKWVSPQSKAQKLLSIMDNALLLMVRALRGNDANSVLQALQLCQNTAVELGTLLEETPGADMSATVELLEQYCDIVYQIYAAIVGDPVE